MQLFVYSITKVFEKCIFVKKLKCAVWNSSTQKNPVIVILHYWLKVTMHDPMKYNE